MKRYACCAIALAVALAVGASAQGALTAWAAWNDISDPPDWYVDAGLDGRVNDTNLECQVAADLHGTGQMPEVELGAGRWGGGLVDGPGDNGLYEYMNTSDPMAVALNSAEGTMEFWFKPDWDPTGEQFDRRGIFSIQGGGGWKGSHFFILAKPTDGDWVDPNGYWAVDHYRQDDSYAGFNFTGNQNLIQDWNHLAYVWDATGNRLYSNGVKIGETASLLEWAPDTYLFLGSFQTFSGYDADGTYDSLAVYDTAIYTGDQIQVPDAEIPVPATLALLGLGGVFLRRRR